jgi:amino acid transporter
VSAPPTAPPRLARDLGLLGLVATGVCSMMGAGINVVPFMLQRSVPGIGPWVLPAYAIAAVPALLAGLAYAILASAMPRAGGSYLYASRGLHPYVGFVASFSQWFGLCIAIGVVSYVLVPFVRDVAAPLGHDGVAAALDRGSVRLAVSLGVLWTFVVVNLRGVQAVATTLLPMMAAMFALGGIVIVAGFGKDHTDFAAALLAREGRAVPDGTAPFDWGTLLKASAVLFSSFIGFDAIAQAGGEARNPTRTLPLAIALAVVVVGSFYFLFTAATYHAVPWQYVAEQAGQRDTSAPALLGMLLPPGWTVAIVAGAAIALANDLPAMILSVSRLMFAWAEDGVFPRAVAAVHPVRRTPTLAIVLSGGMATIGVVGSHFAGDFFLGVDILVTAMLVNFLAMCLAVLTLPRRNPALAAAVRVLPNRALQVPLAALGALLLAGLLAVQLWRDLSATGTPWYLRSTPVWAAVMLVGSLVYLREVRALRRRGTDLSAHFSVLPAD